MRIGEKIIIERRDEKRREGKGREWIRRERREEIEMEGNRKEERREDKCGWDERRR